MGFALRRTTFEFGQELRTRRQALLDLLGLRVVGEDQGVQVTLGSDLELDLFLLLGAASDGDGRALDASGCFAVST